MEGLLILGCVVAVVVLTSLFKTVDMSSKTKNLIATLLSVAGGVLTDLAAKGWDVSAYAGVDILTAALVIYGAAQLIYKFIMEGTKADAVLESTFTDNKPVVDDANQGQ